MRLGDWSWSEVKTVVRLLLAPDPPKLPNGGMPTFRCRVCGYVAPNIWAAVGHARQTGHGADVTA